MPPHEHKPSGTYTCRGFRSSGHDVFTSRAHLAALETTRPRTRQSKGLNYDLYLFKVLRPPMYLYYGPSGLYWMNCMILAMLGIGAIIDMVILSPLQ